MQRYLLEISYNGLGYSGWQVQTNQKTIQGELNEKLSLLLKENINIIGSSRTDTGVHAIQSFAHFDLNKKINHIDLKHKLNSFISPSISVNNITLVSQELHARYSAISRTYEYWISFKKDPFLTGKSFLFPKELDIKLFNIGADFFIGEKDFSSFCKNKSDLKSKKCNVMEAICFASKDMYIFRIKANRFLHNMVRSIVGTLIDFSSLKINKTQLKNIIKSKDRSQAGTTVPPHGLYLMNVEYPKNILCE